MINKKFLVSILIILLIGFYSSIKPNECSAIVTPKAKGNFTILDDADIIGDNITSAQARRGIVITNDGKGGASDYNIPAGIEGDIIYVVAEEAEVITLDLTNADDIIVLPSGALTAGNAIDSDGNLLSAILLICHEGTGAGDGIWYVHSQVGVWVDGGAD